MNREMTAQAEVVEFFSIVSLESEKGKLELCKNIGMKMEQTLQNSRFSSQGECPDIVCKCIN